MAARADRARFARSGQAVARRSNIVSSGSDRRRRGRVQAQKCTLSRGERYIGNVVLWPEEWVQGHENIKEQKRLQEEQREVVIDRVIVEYPASTVERTVRLNVLSATEETSLEDALRLQGAPEDPGQDQCGSVPDHAPEIFIIECRSILASHDLTELRMAPFAWCRWPLGGRSCDGRSGRRDSGCG